MRNDLGVVKAHHAPSEAQRAPRRDARRRGALRSTASLEPVAVDEAFADESASFRDFGADVVLTSKRHRTGTDRIAEAVADVDVSYVINIQGDEPLISPQIIEKVANVLIDNPKALMSTACSPITDIEEIEPHMAALKKVAEGCRLPIPLRLQRRFH